MHVLIVAGTRADRLRSAEVREREFPGLRRLALDAATLPFTLVGQTALWSGASSAFAAPRLIRIDDLELAFPNQQIGGVRLVLTQSTYLLQTLIDRLDQDDEIVATADPAALQHRAPEALLKRGPWRLFRYATVPGTRGTGAAEESVHAPSSLPFVALLQRAFSSDSPIERVALCREAVQAAPHSEVAALCLASACREVEDADGARAALDAALSLAPDWEAAHFENGKLWLAADDMPRARDAFARAAALMPTFSAAFTNLGATLGELDDADGAAAAFQHAFELDPDNFTLLNNIGVVERERGRLEASEEALTRLTTLAPEFVFGHYNLGHTRFLRGDYAGALAAYGEGRQRDPQKNRRQGCRLALVRFANGQTAAAEREFWELADAAPPDEREELLLEAYEIGSALLEAHPRLAPDRQFVDRIGAALTL